MGGAWIPEDRTAVVFEKKTAATVFADFNVTTFDPLFTAIRGVLPAGAYIGGGYPAMLLAGLTLADIDIWFKNEAAFNATRDAIRALLQRPQMTGYGIAEAEKFRFAEFKVSRQGKPLLEVALNGYFDFTGPDHVADTFDFTVAQVVLDGQDMWVGPTTLDDLKARRLVIHRVQPSLIHRVPKYIQKGFNPTAETMLTIAIERPSLVQPIQVAANTALLKQLEVPATMPDRAGQAKLPLYERTKP
jgi:hypothetical protein